MDHTLLRSVLFWHVDLGGRIIRWTKGSAKITAAATHIPNAGSLRATSR